MKIEIENGDLKRHRTVPCPNGYYNSEIIYIAVYLPEE